MQYNYNLGGTEDVSLKYITWKVNMWGCVCFACCFNEQKKLCTHNCANCFLKEKLGFFMMQNLCEKPLPLQTKYLLYKIYNEQFQLSMYFLWWFICLYFCFCHNAVSGTSNFQRLAVTLYVK